MTSKDPEPNNIAQQGESPHWSWTTKLVVGLALVAIFLLLLVRFQTFLGPLITAILLAYLINPIAKFACVKIKIPWRISVTIIYLLLVLIILGLTTWGGFALVDQVQNLIGFIEKNIFQLPDLVAEITERTYEIGPFTFTPTGMSWDEITNEIVRAIQPAIGRLGTLVGSIAAGAVNIITWTVLIVLISYFLLAESAGFPGQSFDTDIAGQREDMQRMGGELNRIWRAFIRGELLIVLISYVIYTILLGIMGVQFFIGLAAVAALGQLIPYLGAWATWVSFGLVALFQTNVPFDLPSGVYMLIVLGVSMVINNVIDNIIRTKIMASGLKVHPSLVLIGAIIGVQLFGFIGIVIAAPIMASFKLFLTYIIRKLGDQDPWEERDAPEPIEETQWVTKPKEVWQAVKAWISKQWQVVKAWIVEQWKVLRQKPSKKISEKSKTPSNPPPPSDEK